MVNFGRSMLPLNLSIHVETRGDNTCCAKNNECTTMIIKKSNSCGESKVTGTKALSAIAKSSINLMTRSFVSPSNKGFTNALTSDSSTDSTSSSTSSYTTTSQTKRVSFSAKAHVRTTISLDDFSDEEYQMSWYSKEDFEQITRSCCKLIKKIDRGDRLESKHCFRGLESHTHTKALAKARTRSTAIQAALAEQYRQARKGIHDVEEIARIYHDASANSQLWANVVGLRDQREAEIIIEDIADIEFGAPRALNGPAAHDGAHPNCPQ